MMRAACVQMHSRADVAANLEQAEAGVKAVAKAGATLVILPEAFAYLGPHEGKLRILEPLPGGGPILDRCRCIARQAGVHLILGGFHELSPEPDKAYNTAVHLDAEGEVRALYRKIHLFDISLPGGATFQESDCTLPGDRTVVTDTPCGRLGLSICYDLRFPRLYMELSAAGAELLAVPSAFTVETGKAHWHVLLRARAIESRCYMLAPAQIGPHFGKRCSFGHSLIVDPWGEVIAEQEEGTGGIWADMDRSYLQQIRRRLPVPGNFIIAGAGEVESVSVR